MNVDFNPPGESELLHFLITSRVVYDSRLWFWIFRFRASYFRERFSIRISVLKLIL